MSKRVLIMFYIRGKGGGGLPRDKVDNFFFLFINLFYLRLKPVGPA